MKLVLLLIIISLFLFQSENVSSFRVFGRRPHRRLHFTSSNDLMEDPHLYQGDIIGPLPDEPKGISMKKFIWPDGFIPYVIDQSVASLTPLIYTAMREIEMKSCIVFRRREDEQDYVRITKGTGCSASVGRRGGEQQISLGKGCENLGIIIHELMHTVGFYHLHQRHDRDDYLNIHWNNIIPSALPNFKAMKPGDRRVDAIFDYSSIMLYGDTSFSKDKVKKTMTPTLRGEKISPPAEKTQLSDVDAYSINRLYQCEDNNHEIGNEI